MLQENVKAVNRDVKALVSDAQSLLQAATALTGEKAVEMQNRGLNLLDAALVKARDTHADAMEAGKKMANSADGYVKDNPWRSVAAAAGVGLLLGAILGRK